MSLEEYTDMLISSLFIYSKLLIRILLESGSFCKKNVVTSVRFVKILILLSDDMTVRSNNFSNLYH